MRLVLGMMSVVLAGCSDVSAEVDRWECKQGQCAVTFTLINDANAAHVVSYAVRAHRIETVLPGKAAARRDVVVGEFRGEVELAASQRQQFTQRLPVKAKPSRIVVTARLTDE